MIKKLVLLAALCTVIVACEKTNTEVNEPEKKDSAPSAKVETILEFPFGKNTNDYTKTTKNIEMGDCSTVADKYQKDSSLMLDIKSSCGGNGEYAYNYLLENNEIVAYRELFSGPNPDDSTTKAKKETLFDVKNKEHKSRTAHAADLASIQLPEFTVKPLSDQEIKDMQDVYKGNAPLYGIDGK